MGVLSWLEQVWKDISTLLEKILNPWITVKAYYIVDLNSKMKKLHCSAFTDIFLGFGVYRNTKVLFAITPKNSKKDLFTCLNGIRFLSMTWVIIGHIYQDASETLFPSSNLLPFATKVKWPWYFLESKNQSLIFLWTINRFLIHMELVFYLMHFQVLIHFFCWVESLLLTLLWKNLTRQMES